jgi:transcriptional regulator with XRE-family HTH domain
MDAALLVRRAREAAGLSVRELASRAGTSHAAVIAYETGRREPRVSTLERLLAAAGRRPRLVLETHHRPDPEQAGRRLAQVLELADALPKRRADERLTYPVLGR